MDDLDPPREMPGAAADILVTLEAFGFEWDEPVLYQGTRTAAYHTAVHDLLNRGLAYRCSCTRREIAIRNAARGAEPARYDGYCRNRDVAAGTGHAVRLRVDNAPVSLPERLRGEVLQDLSASVGDFVIRRRDGLTAYQLAAAVDDAHQRITDVVRGNDLLDSMHRQVHVLDCLGLNRPRYLHLPIIVHPDGQKLSKQSGATGISRNRVSETLAMVLECLGLALPAKLAGAPPVEMLQWAASRWKPERLAGTTAVPLPDNSRFA